ncbi:MAG: signal recognition particle protein [Gammaproteobacteria bacterium RIFCSPHIGHO2_12_FULL_41_15]|nr:MAG: signal recognition particle protein [Gammaproteobacteria bacterium RIFCSPHIGHO2_12_FULL_41_15]
MFSSLSERLTNTVNKLKGIGRLTDKNIKETLQEVRNALIEADVALPVVKTFISQVRSKALGQAVMTKTINPGNAMIKIVQDQLTDVLGADKSELNLKAEPPIVILMAGLQGSGKTTTVGKLAKWLQENHKKSVMVASADVYRPAAIEQLQTLAEQVGAAFFKSTTKDKPVDIARNAISEAKKAYKDVLIIDTAGRLHIDNDMMDEIKAVKNAANPTEILLVVDSMTGQDAANVAKAFNEALPITGIVLTKTDGDARGGAALSMRIITDKPIKLIGTGEKVDGLQIFHPERIAKRILGMGDIVSLVEEAQGKIDKKQAEKLSKKLRKGKHFDFNDFLGQLNQMRKLGGVKSLFSKLPTGMGIPKQALAMVDDSMFTKMESMIRSMTPQERAFPAVINGSRKRRIAAGSGHDIQELNKLLKQFTQMQKVLKRFKGDKLSKQLKQMQNMPGGLGALPADLANLLSSEDPK